ncbi:TetR/AcrR family transcriptional regulator, partial [Candidatus Omnitrophota bacterium]
MRISKNYEERKAELLTTAQQLFYRQGYEQTSVSNIIETVGVSKGTFYYYFKSKEDLFDCLADKMAHDLLHEMKSVINETNLDALSKFRKVFDVTRHWKMTHKELMLTLIKVIYRDENIFIRHKMDKRNLELIAPEFEKIIQQGINENVFNTINPSDAAETIMLLGNQIRESIAYLLIE